MNYKKYIWCDYRKQSLLFNVYNMNLRYIAWITICVLLTLSAGIGGIKAWNGILAEDWDILTFTKWNELVAYIDERVSEFQSIGGWASIIASTNTQGDATFKSLTAGQGIQIDNNANEVIISSTGWIQPTATDISVSAESCNTTSIAYRNFLSAYTEIIVTTPWAEINPVGVIDPTNISTGDANLINNNYSDLVYNNGSQWTINKELPAVDLWSSQNAGIVRIYWWNPDQYGVIKGEIQGSNDGTTWTPLFTNIAKTNIWALPYDDYQVSGSYRYYRLFSVTWLHNTWVVISELEVFQVGSVISNAYHVFNRDIEVKNNNWFIELCNNEFIDLDIEIIHL